LIDSNIKLNKHMSVYKARERTYNRTTWTFKGETSYYYKTSAEYCNSI